MTSEIELLEKWRSELPPIDACFLLKELISREIISTARLEMAASLGSPVAMYYVEAATSWGNPDAIAYTKNLLRLPDHYRTRIKMALVPLDSNEKIRFAYDCASRVFEIWIQEVPMDESVPTALKMIEKYLSRAACSVEEVDKLARDLQNAAELFDDPDKEIQKFPKLVAASESLASVASAVGAVQAAEEMRKGHPPSLPGSLEDCCSYAARFAVKAKTEFAHNNFQTKASEAQWLVEKAEECWQIQRLFNYLLKRIVVT